MTRSSKVRFAFRRFLRMRRLMAFLVFLGGLLLLAIGLVTWFWQPGDKHYELTITPGSPYEIRHTMAEYLVKKASQSNISLTIKPTAGSIESLRAVDEREVDIALVQGGIYLGTLPNVRQVATISSEPLHLLVKEGIHKEIEEDLTKLDGKTLNVSSKGSGTYLLTMRVLSHIGLQLHKDDMKGGVILKHLPYKTILDRLQEMKNADATKRRAVLKELPDAFFIVATLPSRVATQLVKIAGYRLIPLKFGKAFSMISIDEETEDTDHIDQLHLLTLSIPEYTYSVSPPVPPQPCPTLGARMVLVAHKDVPIDALARLVPWIYEGPVAQLYNPPSVAEMPSTYPLHDATIQYRDRDKPLLRSDVVDFFQRLFSSLGPIIAGAIAVYGYYRWRQLLRFNSYFQQVVDIDLIAKGLQEGDKVPENPEEKIAYLHGQLDEVQKQAVADFCDNYFYREGVLYTLLSLIAETRQSLRDQAEVAKSPPAPVEA